LLKSGNTLISLCGLSTFDNLLEFVYFSTRDVYNVTFLQLKVWFSSS